jgi:thiol:disulfide interchange protein DsbG
MRTLLPLSLLLSASLLAACSPEPTPPAGSTPASTPVSGSSQSSRATTLPAPAVTSAHPAIPGSASTIPAPTIPAPAVPVSTSPAPAGSVPVTVAPGNASILDVGHVSDLIRVSSHNAMVATRTFDPHVAGFTGVVVAPQAAINQAMTMNVGAAQPASAGQPGGMVMAQVDWSKVPQQVVFVSNDGNAIAPQLIGKDGSNLNENLMQELNLRKSSDQGLTEASGAATHSILAGTKGPVMTVFMDPNCSWCNRLYGDLAPRIAKGELRVRFILVGFLKEDSRAKSATILAAQDPVKVLADDEVKFDNTTESGGVKPSATPDQALLQVVDTNTQLMNSISPRGTPLILFCNKTTGKADRLEGYPQDMEGLLGRLSPDGHAACSK